MEKTKELLLVHRAMENVTVLESVNVMLTPQFYTLKKEALSVKYAYQAKRIAPSLFEGLLEDDASYEYIVEQEGDTWAFIAYDIQQISTFLQSKGLALEKVEKVFFAQQSVAAFSEPLALSEKEALIVVDETVVVVPRFALHEDEQPKLNFTQHFAPSKSGIRLKHKDDSTAALLTQKQSWSLAAVFMLFAGVFLLEALRYDGESQQGEEKLQALYASYPSLKSSYTRQGIVEEYRGIDKIEREKREVVKTFSGMIFKGVTLTALQMDEKSFKAQFSCTNKDVAKKLKALAQKAKYKTAKAKDSLGLSIEGIL